MSRRTLTCSRAGLELRVVARDTQAPWVYLVLTLAFTWSLLGRA